MSTIRNVFAVIRVSEEPDRFVILGNHRDAWTYGAVDPNSGTAALLEIGSTEWVEQNLGNLGAKVVAYLNVDCAWILRRKCYATARRSSHTSYETDVTTAESK
ncbi:hypothetical protein SUGI_0637510 [Cryptomeria japonica]|nr:hypothetical protein SUGI_0637510 [Cryptomeria japonica]